MPHLGLGLEITSDNRSLATKLANNSTGLWDPNRALNNGAGINSPFTNPVKDISYNGTDLTLVNFNETAEDGYEVITAPNGRQVTALKCDGVDSYGILPNVAGLDPTGLDDFGMAFVIKTSTLKGAYIFAKSNWVGSVSHQYALTQEADGRMFLYLSGGSTIAITPVSTLSNNAFFKVIVKRINGQLVASVNDGITYNQPNSYNMFSGEFARMFARINNADGSQSATFFNGRFLAGDFTLNPTDRWEQDFNAYCQQQFGL